MIIHKSHGFMIFSYAATILQFFPNLSCAYRKMMSIICTCFLVASKELHAVFEMVANVKEKVMIRFGITIQILVMLRGDY